MAALPIGEDDNARALLADHPSNFQPILPGVFNATIGDIERVPPTDSQDSCRSLGFGGALGSAATRPQFTLGEVEDASFVPQGGHLRQRAAASLLYVVAVCRNGQNFNAHVCLSK